MNETEIDRLEAQGRACLDAGELAEALDCLRSVIAERRTGGVTAELRRLATCALKNGLDHSGPGAPEDAFLQCIQAYTIMGEPIDTYNDREILRVACFNIGAIRQRAGRYPEAITYYRDALLLQPSDSGSAVNLAVLLTSGGRAWEAVGILQEAMTLNPDMSAIHRSFINALYESGNASGAVAATQEAARRFPGMRFQHRAVFYPARRRHQAVSV